jgi:hypothetical protein
MSLLVAAHNDVDAMEFWKGLACGSLVELSLPDYRLEAVSQAS